MICNCFIYEQNMTNSMSIRYIIQFVLISITTKLHFTQYSTNSQSFWTYTQITKKALTPDVAFTMLPLINEMAGPLFMFPMVMSAFVNWLVSTSRLKKFLLAPEVEAKQGMIDDLVQSSGEVVKTAGSYGRGDVDDNDDVSKFG